MIKPLYILTFLGLFCSSLLAQQDSKRYKDGEIWLAVDVSKEIAKGLSIDVKEAIRFDNNVSDFKTLFTQATLKYRLFKPLTLAVGYRNSSNLIDKTVHRLMLTSQVRHEFKRYSLSWRMRYEEEYQKLEPIDFNLRNRLKLGYGRKKSDFAYFAAFEVFYNYNYKYADVNKLRYILGLDYKINKRTSAGCTAIFQREVNVTRPSNDKILSFALSYEL